MQNHKFEPEQATPPHAQATATQGLQASADALTKLAESTARPGWHHNTEMLMNGITAAKNATYITIAASAQLMNLAITRTLELITRYYNHGTDSIIKYSTKMYVSAMKNLTAAHIHNNSQIRMPPCLQHHLHHGAKYQSNYLYHLNHYAYRLVRVCLTQHKSLSR